MLYFHSKEVSLNVGGMMFRCDANASQIKNRNISAPTRDMRDPIDDTAFHALYASG